VAVNQAVRAKAAVASLGAAAKAAVKEEEAPEEVAAGVAAPEEPSRPVLRPLSKIGSFANPHQEHPQTAMPGAGLAISPRLLRPQSAASRTCLN
jgi:hypothetical protein